MYYKIILRLLAVASIFIYGCKDPEIDSRGIGEVIHARIYDINYPEDSIYVSGDTIEFKLKVTNLQDKGFIYIDFLTFIYSGVDNSLDSSITKTVIEFPNNHSYDTLIKIYLSPERHFKIAGISANAFPIGFREGDYKHMEFSFTVAGMPETKHRRIYNNYVGQPLGEINGYFFGANEFIQDASLSPENLLYNKESYKASMMNTTAFNNPQNASFV